MLILGLKLNLCTVLVTIFVICPQCSSCFVICPHGTIAGMKPTLGNLVTSASSHVVHSQHLIGKARYPSASISQGGRHSHFLQRIGPYQYHTSYSNRKSRDESDTFGYRPVKHYYDKSFNSTMDVLLHLLRGPNSKFVEASRHLRSNYSATKLKESSSNVYLKSGVRSVTSSVDNHPHGSNHIMREHSTLDPYADPSINSPFERYSHSLYGPMKYIQQQIPSILQHPLFQIVPLLVIEKRYRTPRPPPPPRRLTVHKLNHPDLVDYPPRQSFLKNDQLPHHSKIIFPVDSSEPNFKQKQPKQFQPGGLDQKYLIHQLPHSFGFHESIHQQKPEPENNFPINLEINGIPTNYDSGYPGTKSLSLIQFPDDSDTYQYDSPSHHFFYGNGHSYDPTTGPDLSLPLLQTAESESIPKKFKISQMSPSIPKLERRSDLMSNYSIISVEGKKLKIPDFIPILFDFM